MTPMSCGRAGKLMALYAAGDLAGRAERAVAAHVSSCAPCGWLLEEFRAAREWARSAGAPPEFGDAFYEQLRAGVLDQIRRDERPAPSRRLPLPAAFFPGRGLAYAASFALALAAFALSVSFYFRPAPDVPQRDVVADAKPRDPATPLPTPGARAQRPGAPHGEATPPGGGRTARPKRGRAGGSYKRTLTLQAASPGGARRAAQTVAAAAVKQSAAPEASSRRAEVAEVSRIEIQTADPNIRIIWLAPRGGEEAEPAEADPRR